MRYLSMEWEHLFTYRQRQTLSLADMGIVLIKGENHISHASNSIGSGKSAIWSTLNWGQFGESLPMADGTILRGDDVACRFTREPAEGVFTLEDSRKALCVIHRARRPKKLEFIRNGVEIKGVDDKDLQAKITAALGFGPLTFRHAVIFGQGSSDRFAQSEQSAALRMLDEIQGVNYRKALDRAKRWRDEWTARLRGGQATLLDGHKVTFTGHIPEAAVLQEKISSSTEQLAALEQANAQFALVKAQRINAAEQRVQQAKDYVAAVIKRIADLTAKLAEARTLRNNWSKRQTLRDAWSNATVQTNTAKQNLQFAQKEYIELNNSVEALITNGTCPRCRTEIVGKAIVALRKAFAPDLRTKVNAVKTSEQNYDVLYHTQAEAKEQFERHVKQFPTLTEEAVRSAEAQANEPAVQRAAAEKTKAEQEHHTALATLSTERAAKWEGQAALTAVRQTKADAEIALQENEQNQAMCRRTISVAEYWTEAFGDRGLRSYMFESVEGFLNTQLREHLAILTAGEAEMTMSALSAIKSGDLREKLSMNASWLWGASTYSGGSGGQTRMIDLAVYGALQDLAESRSASPFNLKVFDEPSDGLDSLGLEIFVAWMRQQTAKRGSGFVTTHNEALANLVDPDHTITVCLRQDGSHLEVN